MQEELVVADIQQPFFEYRANFQQPIVDFWFGRRQGEVIEAVHQALVPWQVGFENITWNQVPKNAAELQITFGVPSLLATIQVGMSGVTMTALNPDWSRANLFVSLFQAALDGLKTTVAQEVQSQVATLAFHVKPIEGRPFKQIMGEFVNAKALGGEDASMYGVSIYSSDYVLVIDGSGVIPGGVFIKLIRTFAVGKGFEEMAAALYKDEESALRRLQLKLR